MPEDWERVGRAIEERRLELRLSKAEVQRLANVSQPTLDGYIAGAPIRWADKARGLCEALQWTFDSIDRLAAGGEPISQRATLDDLEVRFEVRLMEEIRAANDALRAEVERRKADRERYEDLLDEIAEMRRQIAELRAKVAHVRDGEPSASPGAD